AKCRLNLAQQKTIISSPGAVKGFFADYGLRKGGKARGREHAIPSLSLSCEIRAQTRRPMTTSSAGTSVLPPRADLPSDKPGWVLPCRPHLRCGCTEYSRPSFFR